jgi:hypothetical protein
MLQTVERVVTFRNAVEHPGGHSGTLHIRNFRPEPNGKFTEPGWWLEKDGKKGRNLAYVSIYSRLSKTS